VAPLPKHTHTHTQSSPIAIAIAIAIALVILLSRLRKCQKDFHFGNGIIRGLHWPPSLLIRAIKMTQEVKYKNANLHYDGH
jgi:hypothetical protein